MEKHVLIHGKGRGCGFHCIQMKQIGVTIGGNEIIKDVSLHIHCGSLTAVIGKNGAGKTTLLKAVLGEIPHTGEIQFTDLKVNSVKKLTIGYVPQTLALDKNTPVSVYDLLAAYTQGPPVCLFRSKKKEEQIRHHLAAFQAEELLDKSVCDLSGGELQRVLLSLATMPVPHLLILDEPASGIDQNGLRMFYETITRIKTEYDMAVLLVSHDLSCVREYADYVILLDKTILAEGEPEKLYQSSEFRKVFGGAADGGNL